MDAPTREEIDAKLETIDVKMEGRIASIEKAVASMAVAIKETNEKISSLKTTIIITAISTGLAVMFGVSAINATLLSNMLASFDSGRSTASEQAEIRRQIEETAALLNTLKTQIAEQKKGQKVEKAP